MKITLFVFIDIGKIFIIVIAVESRLNDFAYYDLGHNDSKMTPFFPNVCFKKMVKGKK